MPRKTNVIWPLFQEPKTKVGGRDAAFTLPRHQRVLTETALYWPPEALPFARAWACVQIALLRSSEANTAFNKALRALELPGCQALLHNAISEFENNQKSHLTPILSLNFGHKFKNDLDYQLYIEHIREFIRVSFNRKIDQENEQHKITAERSPILFAAVVIRTIAEYYEVKLEGWNKYRTEEIDRIMTSNPTTRPERLKKREIRQGYKRLKWVLRHNAKLLRGADQWFRCRVNPSTIEAYLRELADNYSYPERSNIQTEIAPYDEAMCYPRKWRK